MEHLQDISYLFSFGTIDRNEEKSFSKKRHNLIVEISNDPLQRLQILYAMSIWVGYTRCVVTLQPLRQ